MRFARTLTIAAMLAATGVAQAQGAADSFPSRPVTIILPITPGGAGDVEMRLYQQKLSESLRQQFIVDFKPGAGSTLGSAYVAKAAPDGHTLLVASATFTITSMLYKNVPYDIVRDFAPVSLVTRLPSLLVVNPSLPVKSVQEYLAYAKAHPGEINFGVSGLRSFTHLAGAALHGSNGSTVAFIPYKGMGDVMIALAGGQVQAALASTGASLNFVKSGKARALGINTLERAKSLPDIPTIAEQGVPGYNLNSYTGIMAPGRTPPAIVNKLSAEFAKAAHAPDVTPKLAEIGLLVVGSTPEQFRQVIARELEVWGKVARDNKLDPE